jgi:hypothetical protein
MERRLAMANHFEPCITAEVLASPERIEALGMLMTCKASIEELDANIREGDVSSTKLAELRQARLEVFCAWAVLGRELET